MYGVIW